MLIGFGPAEDACVCSSGKYDPVAQVCSESSPMGVLKVAVILWFVVCDRWRHTKCLMEGVKNRHCGCVPDSHYGRTLAWSVEQEGVTQR